MLVYHSLHLVVGQDVDLSDAAAGSYRLPDLHVQKSQLTVGRCLHVQIFHTGTHHLQIAAHIVQALLHLTHLYPPVERILSLPFHDELAAFHGILVVLAGLQILLARTEFFLIEPGVLLGFPLFALYIQSEVEALAFQVEPVLLHGHLRIAQEVLLLGKLRFAVEDIQVQHRIGQPHDDVPLVHHGTLLHGFLRHHSALYGTDLNGVDGLHLTVDADIVVELAPAHAVDADPSAFGSELGAVIAEYGPCRQGEYYYRSPCIGIIFTRDERLLFFYFSIHDDGMI